MHPPLHPPPLPGVVLWSAVILLALVRGERPERLAGALLLADLMVLAVFPDPPGSNVVHWRTLAGDMVVLAGLAALCLGAARSWLIWASGVQTVAVLAHLPRLLDARIHNWAYTMVLNSSGYALVAALLAGVLIEAPRHVRR